MEWAKINISCIGNSSNDTHIIIRNDIHILQLHMYTRLHVYIFRTCRVCLKNNNRNDMISFAVQVK